MFIFNLGYREVLEINYLMYCSYTFQTIQGAKNKLAPSVTEVHSGEVASIRSIVFDGFPLSYLFPPSHPPTPRMATSLDDHKFNNKAHKGKRKESIGRSVSSARFFPLTRSLKVAINHWCSHHIPFYPPLNFILSQSFNYYWHTKNLQIILLYALTVLHLSYLEYLLQLKCHIYF